MVDLRSARAGRRLFQLTPDKVTAPTGVRVLHVLPSTLALSFEASISRSVPVVPVIDGLPAPGYVRGSVVVSPSAVDVVGAESVVRQLSQATTEPVDLKNATVTVRETVNVGLADPGVRLRAAQTAVVTVDILPAPIERVLADVPVAVRNLKHGLRAQVTPRTTTVTVRGAGNVVRQLTGPGVTAFADVSGLQRGRYNLPVRVDLTSDYTIAAVTPSTVSVKIN
jgi:YbbR domain-containing protein